MRLIQASAHYLPMIEDKSIQLICTSPPFWGLRTYSGDQEVAWPAVTYTPMSGCDEKSIPACNVALGEEIELSMYVAHLIVCLREWHRILKDDGIVFINLGDTFASAWAVNRRNAVGNGSLPNGKRAYRPNRLVDGLKEKDLAGVPWRVGLAAQADGWFLRGDIIWAKPNSTPDPASDRPSRNHEYILMLSKRYRYAFYKEAIEKDFLRSVWNVPTKGKRVGHFATYPERLIEPIVLGATQAGDMVLDPFHGSGVTGIVATRLGRSYTGVDLSEEYLTVVTDEYIQKIGIQLKMPL